MQLLSLTRTCWDKDWLFLCPKFMSTETLSLLQEFGKSHSSLSNHRLKNKKKKVLHQNLKNSIDENKSLRITMKKNYLFDSTLNCKRLLRACVHNILTSWLSFLYSVSGLHKLWKIWKKNGLQNLFHWDRSHVSLTMLMNIVFSFLRFYKLVSIFKCFYALSKVFKVSLNLLKLIFQFLCF
jgi:hypothetical protein